MDKPKKMKSAASSSINIGKRRRMLEEMKRQAYHGIPEPYRKSLYEVLQENMKLAERTMYINRLIYIGEHKFEENLTLNDIYDKLITQLNTKEHLPEKLTGFILLYERYFCVMIEGTEEGIIKHLQYLFKNEEINENLGRMKLLVCYHNCNQRFLDTWEEVSDEKPPTLLENLNRDSDIPTTYTICRSCIQKLYALAIDVRPELIIDVPQEEESPSFGSLMIQSRNSSLLRKGSRPSRFLDERRMTLTGTSMTTQNRYLSCLPEYAVLDFLLNSRFIQELRDYVACYGVVEDYVFEIEKIWPHPCDFVPMDVFEYPKDPVTDFPAHLMPEGPGPGPMPGPLAQPNITPQSVPAESAPSAVGVAESASVAADAGSEPAPEPAVVPSGDPGGGGGDT